jgi:hypothetical protein
LYVIDVNSIGKRKNIRNKRLLDIISSVLFIVLFPVMVFVVKKPAGFIKNTFSVLLGFSTWVGYYKNGKIRMNNLPLLKNNILNPTDILKKEQLTDEFIDKLNILYAKDYKTINDITIIVKAIRSLGKQS